jgi:FkbM family methyltransferase
MLYLTQDQYIGASLLHYGEYSAGEVERLCALIEPGDVVIDVGANVGALTVPLARAVGPKGAVFAFEPQPFVFYVLCGNLALNGLEWANAQRQILGAEPGVTQIASVDYRVPGNFGGFSVPKSEASGIIPTVVGPLDAWRLNRCNLIKIDVEGMEKLVIRGAYDTIRRHRPILWIEAEDQPEHPRAKLVQWLERQLPDYTLELVQTPLYSPGNWNGDPTDRFPSVVTTNCLCLPKPKGAH